ncbi:hypothetical protein [Amycolatopsis magusensis]|uniref:hypothetical protein n=1 Tax=Amycolatopsis magusensis TaxID=882444 RepID=UPI003C2FA60C
MLGDVEPERPFFIEYDDARADRLEGWQRAYTRAAHGCTPGRVTYLELGGDEASLRKWVGDIDVPLRFAGGEPRLAAAGIATSRGEIVVR